MTRPCDMQHVSYEGERRDARGSWRATAAAAALSVTDRDSLRPDTHKCLIVTIRYCALITNGRFIVMGH